MNSKNILVGFCVLAVTVCTSQAAIVYVSTFQLGEAGSIVSGRPQDSTGTNHFGTAWNGGVSIIGTTGVVAPGSIAYATFNSDGAYSANFSAFPIDNFAVEMWVRTSNTSQANNEFFVTGNSATRLRFQVVNGNWASSVSGSSNWIGGASGAGQTIVADQWTHLAVIRDSGTSTLYIDGVAQSGTQTTAPAHNTSGHIGVQSGGGAWFLGDIDEVKMFTFNPATDDAVGALNLIPEPATLALLSAGSLGLLIRRWKS